MSVQVKHRRDTAANIAGFTPAQGEIIVDTTNNRMIVGDGTTVGGWAAAKLAEASASSRRAVNDVATTVTTADRIVAYTGLTGARTISLCAASAFPSGTVLRIIDESGACSAANTLTVARAGTDTICGGLSLILNGAYMSAALESDGVSKWTTVNNAVNEQVSLVGVGTAPDPSNPLSVYGASALFNGANFSFTINKGAAANTASVLFQDNFSARAQIGLLGSDNLAFKVSATGASYSTGLVFDAATGAPTFGNARTAVSDAPYSALATDRLIAYTAITAARIVTLPAASAFPAGHQLVIMDESGAATATFAITVTRSGSDTIGGVTSSAISSAYGSMVLESNGSNKWTSIGGGASLLASANAWAAKQTFVASASSAASINLPAGAAPTSPANGDLWATATGLFARINSATFQFASFGRTPVADIAYTILVTDRVVVYTSITAARVVTLPAASAYPAGQSLSIIDEAGAVSATNTITIARTGSDTIGGSTSVALNVPYSAVALVSDGVGKWTAQSATGASTSTPTMNATGAAGASLNYARGDHVHPTDTSRAPTASPTFTGSVALPATTTLNSAALTVAATTGIGTSGATIPLLSTANAWGAKQTLPASASSAASINLPAGSAPSTPTNGDMWTTSTALFAQINGATQQIGAIGRTTVADANYTAVASDRQVSFTSITATRTLTLPSAAAFPVGQQLVIVDESGLVSSAIAITISRAGADTINGKVSANIGMAFGYCRLVSNGVSGWAVVGRSANIVTLSTVGANTYTPTPGLVKADVYLSSGGGAGGGGALQAASTLVSGGGGGGGGGASFGTFTSGQIGASQAVTIGSGGTAGVASVSASTAGAVGGVGGNTTFGSLLSAFGGGGGSGGQLGGGSAGGQGGNSTYAAGSSGSGATGGNNGTGFGAGGSAGFGSATGFYGVGGGGSGGNASGASTSGPTAIQGSAGGASGGGITAANAVQFGANGGASYTTGTYGIGGASSGAAGGAAASPGLAGRANNLFFAGGGGGGAASLTAAGAGGAGGTPGGGGGGGGTAQNGGTAGAGGAGGSGYAIIVEYF